MAASIEYYPEWDNSFTKEQTYYAVTDNLDNNPQKALNTLEATHRLYEVPEKKMKMKNHYA